MSRALLRPDVVLDEHGARRGEAIVIDNGRIAARGATADLAQHYRDADAVDLAGHALMPGTVNAHSHSFQSLLRGRADDQPFATWRDVLYRYAPTLDEEGVHAGALLAFAEMVLRGVTTVVDFFYLHHGNNARSLAVVQAARDVGIRLVLARSMYDAAGAPGAFRETPELAAANCLGLAKELQGDRLVSVLPAPHSPHAASAEMIKAGALVARELEVPWHVHVAESATEVAFTRERYAITPLAWLDAIGALDERVRIIHGVHVEAAEIGAFAAAGGALVHCPGSNLFLGDGVCPLPQYVDAGVPVALGCDSASANSRLSIFSEMRTASVLQKGVAQRADMLTASQVFAMGTSGGAVAAGLPVGTLTPGAHADLVALDLGDLSLQPPGELLNDVVYALADTAVRHVWVGGETVVRDGALVNVDSATVAARARDVVASWS